MNRGAAYGLWAVGIFGICGLHRFYTGRPISGIIWLLTFGFCLVGQIIDVFLIEGMVRSARGSTTSRVGPQNPWQQPVQGQARPALRGAAPATVRERVVEREVVRMRCPYCKQVNEGDAKRCGNCAAWL